MLCFNCVIGDAAINKVAVNTDTHSGFAGTRPQLLPQLGFRNLVISAKSNKSLQRSMERNPKRSRWGKPLGAMTKKSIKDYEGFIKK